MTEWNEIAEADWLAISHGMVAQRFIFDGRNCLDPMAMMAKGLDYVGVGGGTKPQDALCGRGNDKRPENPECQM